MSLSIDLLSSKNHDSPKERLRQRAAFQCGDESLDDYIKTRASQELKKKVSTPFVLTEPPNQVVLGYYCLSSYSLDISDLVEPLAKGLPRYPVLPATLIGRLAVDSGHQGKGYGGYLLLDAMRKVLAASTKVASVALIVDAINLEAVSFYIRHGFIEFPNDSLKLYISMESIEKLNL
jgi:ribosomal protein S18 acetylase RimI-like enzyme